MACIWNPGNCVGRDSPREYELQHSRGGRTPHRQDMRVGSPGCGYLCPSTARGYRTFGAPKSSDDSVVTANDGPRGGLWGPRQSLAGVTTTTKTGDGSLYSRPNRC